MTDKWVSMNDKVNKKSKKRDPKFKKQVHDHMPQCPFTKITDESKWGSDVNEYYAYF